ncbi:MAG: NAD(+)/NADH kinase [Sphaerochaetaceae bacterium]|nr:NAD(+)/NADH kinase [Sphaerochaetaceae bacterium]
MITQKRQIRRVAIIANSTKPNVQEICDRFVKYFNSYGISTCVVMLTSTVIDLNTEAPNCDLAVSLGGDGTVLTCVAILKEKAIPILAVNFGTFGYIAETPVDEMEKVFESYLNRASGIYTRMMLDVTVRRNDDVVFHSSSLNDVTVSTISNARMARMDMYVNGILASKLKADGLILATPTGSTAYSLAAGGPILDASLDAIIVNPICPFTMSVRPLVVNQDSVIRLVIPKQNTDLSITCDGHEAFSVFEGDEITITKGENRAVFVEKPDRKFIEVLRDKLGWAGGFNA